MDMQQEGLDYMLRTYGVGRRNADDNFFYETGFPSLGIPSAGEPHPYHAVYQTTCRILGCDYAGETSLHYENHFNANHRLACSQCKKVLHSPHLLDLHVQERHDSFFAVMAAKKPSYSCYIEECKEKFMTSEERLVHCMKIHRLPKNFRFDKKPTSSDGSKPKMVAMITDVEEEMNRGKTEENIYRRRGFQCYVYRQFDCDVMDMSMKSEQLRRKSNKMKELPS